MIVSFANSQEYINNTFSIVSDYLTSAVLNDFGSNYQDSLFL